MHKVLVVEASKDRRTQIVEALGELTNVSILGAVSDLGVALRALEDAAPTVVVIDPMLLPDEAIALIAEARRRSSTLAVGVFDAEPTTLHRDRCLAAGADVYVAETDGLESLQRAVMGAREVRLRNAARGTTPPF